MKKQVMISQCMIVKNEEDNIEQALSWGKDIVSEQIVVDTGSTDRTVELAKRLGAKVYYFSWNDDFSAAKNFAISKAKHEWIALLDADEYFSKEDAQKLTLVLSQLRDKSYDGLATKWIHLEDDGAIKMIDAQVRIFRNRSGLRYHRRIHEYLAWEDGTGISYWKDTEGLSLFHTGYGAAAKKKKQGGGRNLRLIQAELRDHPDDFEMITYLGNEYVALGEFSLAAELYEKALADLPQWMYGVYHVAGSEIPLRLMSLLVDQPGIPESRMEEIYQKAITGWPEEGDYDYYLGLYYSRHGNYQKGESHIRRGLEIMETYGNFQKSMVISAKILEVYELLAACCLNNGNPMETVRVTTLVLRDNHYLMGSLILFIMAFRNEVERSMEGREGAIQITFLLEKSFYDFSLLKDRMFVLRAAEKCGYSALVQVIRELFSPEELAAIDGT